MDGFCNSHCIPRMCLENIADVGRINTIFAFLDSDAFDIDKGINNAGTFHNICNHCDNITFQEYENEETYTGNFSFNSKLFSQIALKNILRDIYKHEVELEFFKLMPSMVKEDNFKKVMAMLLSRHQSVARKIDIQECYDALNKCKTNIESETPWLDVLICEKVDYVVPIAYQGMISLTTGFNHEVINDKFSYKKGYSLEYIHLAVFPFSKSSVIMLFLDKDNKRYEQFKAKVKTLSKTKKIQLINYLLFLYCEDYFFSKGLSKKTIQMIREIATSSEDVISYNQKATLQNALVDYDLKRAWSFKNVLGIHV